MYVTSNCYVLIFIMSSKFNKIDFINNGVYTLLRGGIMEIPKHVGFILDGNGRWAKERGLSRSEGHKEGFENLKDLSKYIFKKGVKVLSVYAFSTENFKRSKEEVDFLMNLFIKKFI